MDHVQEKYVQELTFHTLKEGLTQLQFWTLLMSYLDEGHNNISIYGCAYVAKTLLRIL